MTCPAGWRGATRFDLKHAKVRIIVETSPLHALMGESSRRAVWRQQQRYLPILVEPLIVPGIAFGVAERFH
jgi:hypothetical protein